jgi:hypothetical protein
VCAGMLVGCSASVTVGIPQISVATLESSIAQKLANQLHQPVPNVVCPRPLDDVVDAKTQCVLTAQGSTTRYAVSVVVTSVSKGTAHYSVQVADQPLG